MKVECMNAVRPAGEWIRCGNEFEVKDDLDLSQVVCPSCLRSGTVAPVIDVPKPPPPPEVFVG